MRTFHGAFSIRRGRLRLYELVENDILLEIYPVHCGADEFFGLPRLVPFPFCALAEPPRTAFQAEAAPLVGVIDRELNPLL